MKRKNVMAVLLSLVMVFALAACGAAKQGNSDGSGAAKPTTYSATGKGHDDGLKVSIDVVNGAVTGCTIDASKETPGVGGQAAPKLQEQIAAGTMPGDIDSVAGATDTCNGIIALYKDCLTQAGIKY